MVYERMSGFSSPFCRMTVKATWPAELLSELRQLSVIEEEPRGLVGARGLVAAGPGGGIGPRGAGTVGGRGIVATGESAQYQRADSGE